METDTEVWDGTFVEYYNVASVLSEHLDTHVDELIREIKHEMREDGYVPMAGTEDYTVLYSDKNEVVKRVEVVMTGKWYGPDARKIEYVTESGEITWRNTDRNKSSRLLTN